MQAALESVAGVESAAVNFQTKTATVTCEGNCDTTSMITALEKAGYGGRVEAYGAMTAPTCIEAMPQPAPRLAVTSG